MNVVFRFPGGAQTTSSNISMGMHLGQGAAGDVWLIAPYLILIQIFYNSGFLL